MTVDAKTPERLGRIILERETQSRVSSFLLCIKHVNAGILSQVNVQPVQWPAFEMLHGQFYRELELIGMLQRVTEWCADPALYVRAGLSNLRHLGDLQLGCYLMAPFAAERRFYRYLALSHALYAHVRFIPLLPLDLPLEHRYLAFLHTLETVHGRQMQAQIALLNRMPVDLEGAQREDIVGEESRRVREVFHRFVRELTGPSPAS